jgi:hypothetical protein
VLRRHEDFAPRFSRCASPRGVGQTLQTSCVNAFSDFGDLVGVLENCGRRRSRSCETTDTEDDMLFNSPAFGYRHQVAAWSSLHERRGFNIRARWHANWNVAHSAGSGTRVASSACHSHVTESELVHSVRKHGSNSTSFNFAHRGCDLARWSIKRRWTL